MSEFPDDIDRALFACRLWLHTGFVGAVALAAGLLEFLDEPTKWAGALALAFFGGLLAIASWCRGLIVLERAEWPPHVTDAPDASTSHACRERMGCRATDVQSPIPLPSHRRHDREFHRPAPE